MRIFDPKNEYGDELITKIEVSDSYLTKTDAGTTYATISSLGDYLRTSDASTTYLTQTSAADTYAPKSTAVTTDQILTSSLKLTKSITDNAITITTTDISDITSWTVGHTEVLLSDGTIIQILPDFTTSSDSITMTFGDGSKTLDFDTVYVYMHKINTTMVNSISMLVL